MRNRPLITRVLNLIYDGFNDMTRPVRNVPWDRVVHANNELILEDDEGREYIVTVREAKKSRLK